MEEIMAERGLRIDHSTIYRWVQKYAPELEKRSKLYLKTTNDSWRTDETYIKIKKVWTYLYRTVDSEGNTLEFMLSKSRDNVAATRFFRKALGDAHTVAPRVITVDKNPAYPKAFSTLKDTALVSEDCELRQIKYLNNIVEQDHRFIKRRVKPGLGFYSFKTAWATLRGYEIMNMIRKGQIKGVAKGNILRQIKFIHQAFGLVV